MQMISLPDDLLVAVETAAAATGQSMQSHVTTTLREKLAQAAMPANGIDEPGWLQLAGIWKEHAAELAIVEAAIEAAFEHLDEEMWA
jgi:hypothetical protein